jgi:hypothetical protein
MSEEGREWGWQMSEEGIEGDGKREWEWQMSEEGIEWGWQMC